MCVRYERISGTNFAKLILLNFLARLDDEVGALPITYSSSTLNFAFLCSLESAYTSEFLASNIAPSLSKSERGYADSSKLNKLTMMTAHFHKEYKFFEIAKE